MPRKPGDPWSVDRSRLPSDAEMWAHPTRSWIDIARATNITPESVRRLFARNGWTRHHGKHPGWRTAPCARCGKPSPVAELDAMRVHTDTAQCSLPLDTPVRPPAAVEPDPNGVPGPTDYEWEAAHAENRRRKRLEAIRHRMPTLLRYAGAHAQVTTRARRVIDREYRDMRELMRDSLAA